MCRVIIFLSAAVVATIPFMACNGDGEGNGGAECGGFIGIPCDNDQVCDVRMCGEDVPGQCVPAPEACTTVYDPVCGCDGVTYGNDCERLSAGVALDHEGACSTAGLECGGLTGIPCDNGQVCDVRMCGEDVPGLCVPAPEVCTTVYDPVCGCDGVTYGNDCVRLGAEVALDHEGAC